MDLNDDDEYPQSTENKRAKLFESDDEEDNDNLNIADFSDNEEREELFQLQGNFKGDDRFRLNTNFLDNENKSRKKELKTTEDSLDEEKKAEINILQEVLGGTLKPPKPTKVDKKKVQEKRMLRFDPSEHKHMQYQIEAKPKLSKADEKFKHKKQEVVEAQPPSVSKETFYAVDTDFQQTLKGNKEFSILELLGRDQTTEQDENLTTEEQSNNLKFRANPFLKDPSDDEMSFLHEDDTNKETSLPENNRVTNNNILQTFFFKEDDYRLQEGEDFIKRIGSVQHEEFSKQRYNMKHIVKNKVRHNNRKANPFKKKLGGRKNKKKIRIQKAFQK